MGLLLQIHVLLVKCGYPVTDSCSNYGNIVAIKVLGAISWMLLNQCDSVLYDFVWQTLQCHLSFSTLNDLSEAKQ